MDPGLQDLLTPLESDPRVSWSTFADPTVLVDIAPNLLVELTIPDADHTLEWFIAVKDPASGRELVTDWCDHYAVAGESPEELRRERWEEIEEFLTKLLRSPLRIAVRHRKAGVLLPRKTTHILERRVEERWEPILPFGAS